MKRWIPTRSDRRHAALAPANRRCLVRRLAFERCEDRRMLSGSSLTTEYVNASLVGEGGFLAVNTSGFLLTDANNFLFDADSFSQLTTRLGLSAQWQPTGVGQQLSEPDFSGTLGDEFASSIAPVNRPALYDLDLSVDSLVPTAGKDNLSSDDELIVDDRPGVRANDSPGLQGKTTKLLVIEDPVQIVASPHNSDELDQREGGALEVATAVHTTQRAYETQLSAIIAHNLNHDGMLPTTLPTRPQPVVAELARVVAFETLGQQELIPTGEIDRVTSGQLQEPTQATPLTLEPVSAQLHVVPVQSRLINDSTSNEMKTRTSQSSHRGEDALANLAERVAERVDNEQHAAQIITFAQWPTLATVIAGYLLVERRRPQASQAVQIPPRRRLVRHKTPAS